MTKQKFKRHPRVNLGLNPGFGNNPFSALQIKDLPPGNNKSMATITNNASAEMEKMLRWSRGRRSELMNIHLTETPETEGACQTKTHKINSLREKIIEFMTRALNIAKEHADIELKNRDERTAGNWYAKAGEIANRLALDYTLAEYSDQYHRMQLYSKVMAFIAKELRTGKKRNTLNTEESFVGYWALGEIELIKENLKGAKEHFEKASNCGRMLADRLDKKEFDHKEVIKQLSDELLKRSESIGA
ncbi:MAG: hypothetical protein WC501_01895 [Candidatus Micrarchaeia archaeon]